MIRNNGMIECNELLLDYFKFDYQRIDGHLFKNTFNFRLRDSYPYTLSDILADFWNMVENSSAEWYDKDITVISARKSPYHITYHSA